MKRLQQRRCRGDRGAALAEFAIVCPLIFTLLFGMITGGLAYNENLAITYTAQQTARYGATLPKSSYGSTDLYLDALFARVLAIDEDELANGTAGRSICVSYVYPTGGAGVTRSRTSGTSDTALPTRTNNPCFTDGLATTEKRVQVSLSKDGEINLLFETVHFDIAQRAVAHYEGSD